MAALFAFRRCADGMEIVDRQATFERYSREVK
jgi:hypothetical protein